MRVLVVIFGLLGMSLIGYGGYKHTPLFMTIGCVFIIVTLASLLNEANHLELDVEKYKKKYKELKKEKNAN